MPIQAMMKHLGGRFWFAERKRFDLPGIYFWTGKRSIRVLPLPRLPEPMQLAEFPEQTILIGKGQEKDYRPLPAYRFKDDMQGRLVCCWKLNFRERLKLLFTGRLWHQILTFRHPLQPQQMQVDKPDMPKEQGY